MAQTRRWLTALGGATASFAVLDAAWIGGVAKKVYDKNIPHLMASQVNAAPAGLFYAGYLAGTVYLAVKPGQDRTSVERFRDGAILGALAYGTFGFTNSAVLKDFPVKVAASDCAWGAVLTGTTAVVAGKVSS